MTKVLGVAVLAVGAVALSWWWWQESKRPTAEAWAAGTDRLG